jgi:hypothetical protein
MSAGAICVSGSTSWAAPWAMASRGMPNTTQLASSWHQVPAAGVAHGAHGARAVGAHAGEHHAQRVGADHAGGGLEQHFHRLGLWRLTGSPSRTRAM